MPSFPTYTADSIAPLATARMWGVRLCLRAQMPSHSMLCPTWLLRVAVRSSCMWNLAQIVRRHSLRVRLLASPPVPDVRPAWPPRSLATMRSPGRYSNGGSGALETLGRALQDIVDGRWWNSWMGRRREMAFSRLDQHIVWWKGWVG